MIFIITRSLLRFLTVNETLRQWEFGALVWIQLIWPSTQRQSYFVRHLLKSHMTSWQCWCISKKNQCYVVPKVTTCIKRNVHPFSKNPQVFWYEAKSREGTVWMQTKDRNTLSCLEIEDRYFERRSNAERQSTGKSPFEVTNHSQTLWSSAKL